MASFTKKGYGQVEPNHLSAQRTAQIYAQLPATGMDVLENGTFVKYDYPAGKVDFTGDGEWMLVYNEVKLYDGYRESYADFAMKKADFSDGVIYPRVFKTNVGDIYTTNNVKNETLDVNDLLVPGARGVLEKKSAALSSITGTIVWKIVKVTNMADGQPAVKIQRVK